MSTRVVIFGTGDFAQVAATYLAADSSYEVAAFTVHDEYRTVDSLLGKEVVAWENIEERFPPDQFSMFIAIGFSGVNRRRTEVYDESKRRGYRLITYVSSKASYWDDLAIGDNCFVFENNVIQPFVRIGNNVIVWSGNHIGHHSVVEDNCFIASHAVISGHVTIGRNSFVGVNATFHDGVRVAEECVIGAGAVIAADTVPRGVYKGPASQPGRFTSDQLRNF